MTTATAREILDQEARLTRATRDLDLDALDRLYADDILFTGVTGELCGKAALMDEARRGLAQRRGSESALPVSATYEKDDINVAVHADTGVASFRFTVSMRHEGRDVVRRFRTTNVWMKRAGAWRIVAAHTASLNVPPA